MGLRRIGECLSDWIDSLEKKCLSAAKTDEERKAVEHNITKLRDALNNGDGE